MSKSVKFDIKLNIDGRDVVVAAKTNVQDLANGLNQVESKGLKAAKALIGFNQAAQAFQNLSSGLQQLTGVLGSYSQAHNVQMQAETKLATIMRERMNATDADIAAIRELTSAQQSLGVVGDEVQLMGAQQIATFAANRQTIETLIPAMNDLLVQQRGLAATGQDAVSIGNLIGKALQGNVTALQRVGITLSESQKQLIKYGDEGIRAATLAEVITANVGHMNAEMANTSAGKAQQLSNTIGDLKEQVGALFSRFQPAILAVAEFTLAFNGIAAVTATIYGLGKAVAALHIGTRIATAVQVAYNWTIKEFAAVSIAATMGASRLQVALYGLRAAAGPIAILATAVLGLVAVLHSASDASAEAAAKMRGVADAAEIMKSAEDAGTQAAAKARVEMDAEIKKLGALIKSKGDTSKAVNTLNGKYGEWFGKCRTAQEWYNTLISKSQAYCMQLGYEAQMRVYAEKKAQLEVEKLKNEQKQKELRESGKDVETATKVIGVSSSGAAQTATYQTESKAMGALKSQAIQTDAALEEVNKNMGITQQLMDKNAKSLPSIPIAAAISTSTTPAKTGSTPSKGGKTDTEKHLIAEAKTYTDLANNVAYYQQELEKADLSDTESISTLTAKKRAAEEALQAYRDMVEAMGVPAEPKTLEDYDQVLQHLRKQRSTATSESIAGIDAEISKTEKARQAIEDMTIAAKREDELRTYDDINAKMAYYNRLLQTGDESQRRFAVEGVARLKKLQEQWEAIDEAATTELDPAKLNTLKELEAAISHLRNRQQGESGAQIGATQAEIDKLTKKQSALQLRIDMPAMEKQLADLKALSGKEYRVKVQGIGFEGLRDKIKEIEELMKNPNLASDQLEQLRNLRDGYASMLGDSISTMGEMRKGWEGVKGIGSSIDGITKSLEGNANAWQIVCGIIDGSLAIYDGFKAVIGIIQLLTTASQAHSVAKTVEAGATIAAGTAETATIPAAEAAAAAEIPLVAANKVAAASYLELAAAAYLAAHAYIPFAGFGIGAGFATAAKALVAAMAIPLAQGGIMSGPTFALVGEYAGASNNPEVVAPLDKLRSYLEPNSPLEGSQVHFRIDGRDLVGVLKKETRYTNRIG